MSHLTLVSLAFVVFVLGLRHGLDADHLAYIDGQTRHTWNMRRSISPWVGTLFAIGHGTIVLVVAVLVSMANRSFHFPAVIDDAGTWVSVITLFMLALLNMYNLLRKKPNSAGYQLVGLKGRLMPRFIRETTNPLMIAIVGGFFAMAADTVSQTSMWALASGAAQPGAPFILGVIFIIGMVITDTADSILTFRTITKATVVAEKLSRAIGWSIAWLALLVSLFEAISFFRHDITLDFELTGAILLAVTGLYFIIFSWTIRLKIRATTD